ncbi:MAG: hypothetical protein H6739_20990 [Alphaproteobacteria bacterium]|nr:hypothetical protein [Alphaproteobacteria bacterium]
MIHRTLPLLLALGACKAPEAPDTIEEMMVYGFENFEAEDPAYMVALAEKLIPWMDNHMAEAEEGYAVNALGDANLAAAGVDATVEEEILGAVTGVDFVAPPEDLAAVYVYPHQDEIFDTYIEFTRETDDDPDCFAEQRCEFFRASDDVHIDMGVLGIEMFNGYDTAFRWIELSDGTKAIAHRNLGPLPIEFTVNFLAVYQQYSFSFSYARPDGTTRRAWTIWADGEVIGADLPESWQISQGVSAMHNAAENINAWLRGETGA